MADGFGATIRAERQRMQLTLSAFADLVGCSLATLKRWESGQVIPPASHREFALRAIHTGQPQVRTSAGVHTGWWLWIARSHQRLTIREAAAKTGLSSSCWQRYECGITPLGVSHAAALSSMIGLETSEFAAASPSLAVATEIARQEYLRRPIRGIERIIGSIVNQGSEERTKPWIFAHELLGRLLISVGEYDLAGKAYSALLSSLTSGARTRELDPARVSLGTVWNGFRLTDNPKTMLRRLRWLETQLTKIPRSESTSYAVPRTIFADRANRPDLAKLVVQNIAHSDDDPYPMILFSWLESKYGNPKRAVAAMEPMLDADNIHVKFAAHKVCMTAFWTANYREASARHFQILQTIERDHGLRLVGVPRAQIRALELYGRE